MLLACGVALIALFCLQPLPLMILFLTAPLLCWLYWYGVTLYQQGTLAKGVTVQSDGQLQWWQSKQPGGKLTPGCLVSEFMVLLRWQSADQRQHQQWLLADQFTDVDFRALARLLNQLSWQQPLNHPAHSTTDTVANQFSITALLGRLRR
ncbi:hypothetical protein VT06_10745 [Arsukibacterium sp. MJ3]|nr:protein YgfX [Arsukibacterium sp. MJ3]KKO48562.1 hypothetical protein VT06_10745 [Arsukibacterium sp. MJ3]